MTDATAESCTPALRSDWIARFPVLVTITTDRGPQFESHLWTALMHLQHEAQPYHGIPSTSQRVSGTLSQAFKGH